MKSFILILISIPFLAHADCPYEISVGGKQYCLDLQWKNGEKKVQGAFKVTDKISPHLVAMGEIPPLWVYSQVSIKVWEKGDQDQNSVKIPGFRIFPYMHMESGHHHSTGYDFFYDEDEQDYLLREVAFQQMRGCWSLRWTTHHQDSLDTSNLLDKISEYANLSDKDNKIQAGFCEKLINQMGHEH